MLSIWHRAVTVSCLAVLFLLATRQWASGASLYVSAYGSNSGARASWSTAYNSIQPALDAAGAGDTVYVAGGKFMLAEQLSWTNSGVTLCGGYAAAGDETLPGPRNPRKWRTIIGMNPGVDRRVLRVIGVSDGTMQGVDIRDGRSNGHGGGIYLENCANFNILESRFVDNQILGKSNNYYGGGICASNSTGVISNVLVAANVAPAHDFGLGMGIYISGGACQLRDSEVIGNAPNENWGRLRGMGIAVMAGTHTMRNILVAHNYNTVLHKSVYCLGGGLYVAPGVNATIENATIVDNAEHGIYSASTNLVVRNSIICGNFPDFAGSFVTLKNNLIADGSGAGGSGTIAGDPLFEEPLLYLGAGSPALDAGDRTAAEAGLDGYTTRTNGVADSGAVDLGYHFTAGSAINLDLFVDPVNGQEGNDGLSAAAPLPSISAALALVESAARIHLAPGRYTTAREVFPLRWEGRVVQLLGSNAVSTVVDAAGANARAIEVTETLGANRIAGVTIAGADVTNAYAFYGTAPRDPNGAGLFLRNAAMEVLHARIMRNTNQRTTTRSSTVGGGMAAFASRGVIRDVDLLGNRASAHDNSRGGGAHFAAGAWRLQGVTAIGNRMVNVGWGRGHGAGFSLAGGRYSLENVLAVGNDVYLHNSAYARGGGIYVAGPATRLAVANATMAGNSEQALYSDSPYVSMRNSIVFRNIWSLGGATVALTNNCIEDAAYGGGNGNFTADPQFVTPHFYLADESPARNAGDRSAAAAGLDGYTTAVDGSPDEGAVDLGYHFRTGLPPMADLYVDPVTGDDNAHDGLSPAAPLATVSRALAGKQEALRIHLAAGRYDVARESFPLTVEARSVQLRGAGRTATIIDAAAANTRVMEFLDTMGDNRLADLTVCGGKVDGSGAGVSLIRSTLSINNVTITGNNMSTTVKYGAGMYAESSFGLAVNLTATNNTMAGHNNLNIPNQGGGAAIMGGMWQIDRSCFSANRFNAGAGTNILGLALWLGYGNHVLYNLLATHNILPGAGNTRGVLVVDNSTRVAIENVTIADNTGGGIQCSTGLVQVLNSIITGQTMNIAGAMDITNSCSPGLVHGVNGNITNAPLFMGFGDYRLQAGSPCVNSGLNREWMKNATDFAGNRRISMVAVDMGCLELQAPAATIFVIR